MSIDRGVRRLAIVVGVATLTLSTSSGVGAAYKIDQTGSVGASSVTDTVGSPGARCIYDGAAGTLYLQRVRSRAPTIYGMVAQDRSVGYRAWLQYRQGGSWHTAQKGPLISGVADSSHPADLPDSTIVRNPDVAPNGVKYRTVLKLIWWDAHANIVGTVKWVIEHHRHGYDGSVGPYCRGRVLTGAS
jgi:hypothetical protein